MKVLYSNILKKLYLSIYWTLSGDWYFKVSRSHSGIVLSLSLGKLWILISLLAWDVRGDA